MDTICQVNGGKPLTTQHACNLREGVMRLSMLSPTTNVRERLGIMWGF